jgi:hypothetical protein
MASIIPADHIAASIHWIRKEKVILDRDLAELYGVETRVLKQAVKRNLDRFPSDFMFTLSAEELDEMVSQNVIPSKKVFGGAQPMAFTEQGVAMLSSVLRSPQAVQVNIAIMRTFVELRSLMDSNRELAQKIDSLEDKYDEQFTVVFEAIKRLLDDNETLYKTKTKRMGFHP